MVHEGKNQQANKISQMLPPWKLNMDKESHALENEFLFTNLLSWVFTVKFQEI